MLAAFGGVGTVGIIVIVLAVFVVVYLLRRS